MRALCVAVALALSAGPVWANARMTLLMDALMVSDVVEILRAEGFAYAQDLNQDMLGGQGGAFWQGQIRQIYNGERITEQLRQALEQGLEPDEVEAALAFFATEEGTRIVTLENAARRAMSDPAVEAAARDVYTSLKGGDDPLYKLVTRYINDNDLVERNVTGGMSANVQFYMGLSDGGFTEQSEAEILEEVWSQQDGIREDTEYWLNGFLLMAYQPLPLDTMQAYVDYSSSDPGQALNAALFDGFEGIYRDISYALGRAIALNAEGDGI